MRCYGQQERDCKNRLVRPGYRGDLLMHNVNTLRVQAEEVRKQMNSIGHQIK